MFVACFNVFVLFLKDFRDWISRLRAFPTQIDQTIALLTEGLRIGMTPPRDVMKDVVGNMNGKKKGKKKS